MSVAQIGRALRLSGVAIVGISFFFITRPIFYEDIKLGWRKSQILHREENARQVRMNEKAEARKRRHEFLNDENLNKNHEEYRMTIDASSNGIQPISSKPGWSWKSILWR